MVKLQKTLKSLFPDIKEESLSLFIEESTYIKCKKGTELISEGKRHSYFYLIIEGSVKAYYRRDAKEICTWFAFEDEFIATISTFEGLSSKETIEVLEDSELIRFKTEKVSELAKTNLAISQIVNSLIIEHAVYLEERLYQLQFMTSQERYKALLKALPEIVQRVSLTDIASFIGVSRETLSRIRAKK